MYGGCGSNIDTIVQQYCGDFTVCAFGRGLHCQYGRIAHSKKAALEKFRQNAADPAFAERQTARIASANTRRAAKNVREIEKAEKYVMPNGHSRRSAS